MKQKVLLEHELGLVKMHCRAHFGSSTTDAARCNNKHEN